MTLFANNNSRPILEIKRNSDHIKNIYILPFKPDKPENWKEKITHY